MYPTYQPTSLGHTLVALAFYIITAGFILYSIVALYALLRFGKSKIVAILVSVFYLIVMASLYTSGILQLNSLK
jgi:hypothetical protein